MTDKRVSVVKCGDYQRERVSLAVKQAVDLLGGIRCFASPGEVVLLKPNLLQGISPDRCVTTHPEVIYAIGLLLKDLGCKVVIADSPGGGIRYTSGNLIKAYRAAGYNRIAEELGIELNLDTSVIDIPNPGGVLVKRFPVIKSATMADRIIGISKAKTHMWTLLTGASKNLFGLIPGLEKPAFHSRFRDESAFSQMILDLDELIQADLHLMDAVIGMEADGPLSGAPRQIGVILASPSALALDTVAAQLMEIPPADVPVLRRAQELGMIREDAGDITLLGDFIGELIVSGYRKPSTYVGSGKGLRKNASLSFVQQAGSMYTLKPMISPDLCVGCGKCRMICPVQAISIEGKVAHINSRICIRCYCCHEMCTDGAVVLRRSIAGRVISWFLGVKNNQ